MNAAPLIRSARPADLPAITAIYAHAVINGTASYEYDPPSLAEMTARFDALATGGFPFIVAETTEGDGGIVLGYAYASHFRTRPAYRFTVEDSIYIAQGERGRGLGRLLLAELIRQCEALGFRQMIAVIGDGRVNHASVRLHQSMGFAASGWIVGSGYKHGRWCDTALMQLSLNGGAGAAPDPSSLPERRFGAARG